MSAISLTSLWLAIKVARTAAMIPTKRRGLRIRVLNLDEGARKSRMLEELLEIRPYSIAVENVRLMVDCQKVKAI
jgi:hypothetical protein